MLIKKIIKKGFKTNGKPAKNPNKETAYSIVKCDDCEKTYETTTVKRNKMFEKWKKDMCGECNIIFNKKRISLLGAKILSSRTKKQKIKDARNGGLACQKSLNKDVVSFSSGRWEKMDEKQRYNQVMKANDGLQKKLQDPKYKKKHFEKVFKYSKIGYISKGQREVYEFVKNFGFQLEQQIGSLKADVVSFELKKVIEYNGDFYHCNPRHWKETDYNKTIKMTAKEKWECDRNRRFYLRKMGYEVLVIWENEWIKDNKNTKEKILYFIRKSNENNKNN